MSQIWNRLGSYQQGVQSYSYWESKFTTTRTKPQKMVVLVVRMIMLCKIENPSLSKEVVKVPQNGSEIEKYVWSFQLGSSKRYQTPKL